MKKNMLFVVIIGMIFSTCVLSQNVPGYISKNGLVGYWPFNGDTKDYSGNGNDGILNSGNYSQDRKNEQNKSLKLNTNNDYVSGTSSLMNNQNFTISVWVNLSSFSNTTLNIFKACGARDELKDGYRLYADDGGNIIGLQCFNNSTINTIDKKISKLNEWIQVIAVKNGKNVQLYVNGIKINEMNFNSSDVSFSNNNFFIGNNGNENNDALSLRLIDELVLWNRSLNQTEINTLFIECQKQNATTSSFDKIILQNDPEFQLSALPNGGNFYGIGITNNQLDPSKNKLGKNYVDYIFKNVSGCDDTTRFGYMVYDTLGITCTKTDTIKVNKTIYDTIVIYDTITTHQTVTDTLKIKLGLTTGLYANQQHIVQIYPNPTASDLLIDFGNQEKLKGYVLIINDASGKQVYKDDIQNQKSIVKLSSLGGKGVYVVNILDANSKMLVVKQIILE